MLWGREGWDWLGTVADVVSLLTLPVTVWAAVGITRLRLKLAHRASLARILADLDIIAVELAGLTDDTDEARRRRLGLLRTVRDRLEFREGEMPPVLRTKAAAFIRAVSLVESSGTGYDEAQFWVCLDRLESFKTVAAELEADHLLGVDRDRQ